MELDRGARDTQLLVLGQEVCRSCLQLPHCEQQRQPIAQELGNRGAIGQTVIGAEIIEIPKPEFDQDTPRSDTSFTFDLQYPLTEPSHALEIIRQGFRSKQLSVHGTTITQHKALFAHLEEVLRDKSEQLELFETEAASWADMAARLILKYHRAVHSDWSIAKQRAPLSKEDMQAAAAIQDIFVEDVLALRDAGFKKPEILARVHSPEFYSRLFRAYDSDSDASIGLIHQILGDSDVEPIPERHNAKAPQARAPQQPTKKASLDKREKTIVESSGRQQLFEHFAPQFEGRNIGISYLKLNLPEAEIRNRLALYDEAVKVHSTKIMSGAIHYYCFRTDVPDPTEAISAWKRAVANVDPSCVHVLGRPNIKKVALNKRGEELKHELDNRVKLFNELSAEYAQSPHPAVDDEVIKRVLYSSSTARKQLKNQERRWDAVHAVPEVAEIIAEMDADVLRRILMLNRTKPAEAIQAYQRLQNKYLNDDYIEPSMIDNAIKWGLRQAAISVNNLRNLLQRTEIKRISIYKEYTLKGGDSIALHERMADTRIPDIDTQIISSQIDSTAPTREETRLLESLNHLPHEERAAVATVYQIPWLLPQDLQDDGWAEPDKVCNAFNVHDIDELEPIVEAIIRKLSDK